MEKLFCRLWSFSFFLLCLFVCFFLFFFSGLCWETNRRFPSCLSPLFQSESQCEAFHMEISFIHIQNLRVNKTNFHMKGFAVGFALKQRRRLGSRKSPIYHRTWEEISAPFGFNSSCLKSLNSIAFLFSRISCSCFYVVYWPHGFLLLFLITRPSPSGWAPGLWTVFSRISSVRMFPGQECSFREVLWVLLKSPVLG